MPGPRVLIIDDHELDDVHGLLRELGVEPIRATDLSPAEDGSERAELLVVSARKALSLSHCWALSDIAAVTIAIIDGESKTLCTSLQRLGFNYLVRRPVHPEALRLLLVSALYRRDNRRRLARQAAGCTVRWIEGWRRRQGTLLELSSGGCRVLARHRMATHSTISIVLPRHVAGWPALRLKGSVARATRDAAHRGMLSMAVVFGDLSPRTRRRLEALLAELQMGPVVLSESSGARSAEGTSNADASSPGRDRVLEDERRLYPRGAFQREVLALDRTSAGVRNILVGRDLSVGGIRVEAHPALRLGDRIRVAFYDALTREPLTVTAEVIRDDGSRGLGLRFANVDVATSEQVQHLVETLPTVADQSEVPGEEDHYSGVFFAEIVEGSEGDSEKDPLAGDAGG